jgi:hypothetical protein
MAQKALLVGIDNYSPPNKLPSCVRDAKEFADRLKTVYKFDGIRILLDSEATKKGIEGGLEWLFQGADPGDRLVFFYSGHGYSYAKGGVYEEALVPQDGQFFTDDELSARTQMLPPGILTVILDACFSGGMEKVILTPEGEVEVTKISGVKVR